MVALLILAVALFAYAYDGEVESYESSVLALSYKYGFLPRALVGTLYQWIGGLFPGGALSYSAVKIYVVISTLCVFALLFRIISVFVKHSDQENLMVVEPLCVLLVLFTIPQFVCSKNFGRPDLYLVLISAVVALIFVRQKHYVLLMPLSIVGMLVHEGYIFMLFNVLFVLLFCEAADHKEHRKKYLIYLGALVLINLVLLFYFELFSHSGNFYDQIVQVAKALSLDGDYHETLIQHEILGTDVSDGEVRYHKRAFIQLILAAIFMFPIFPMFRILWKGAFSVAEDFWQKAKYFFVFAGELATLPLFIFKLDFGRWVYCVILYFVLVFIVLMLRKDPGMMEGMSRINALRLSHPEVVLIYPYLVLMVPFLDISINEIFRNMSIALNQIIVLY